MDTMSAVQMKKTWRRGGFAGRWLSVLLAMMAVPAVTQATIYTGTDANGIRWFSDTAPPRGAPVQTLSLSAGMEANVAPEVPSGVPAATPKTRRTSARKPQSQAMAPRKQSSGKSSRRQAPTMTHQARQAARLRQHCQSVEQALRKINAQMRAGYRARQGQRLRQRRQALLDQQFADCPTRASR